MISLKIAPRFLILARALRMANFLLPVSALFYVDKGATIGDLFLIQGIWGVSIFFLEIPSGYIGDIMSRKRVVAFSFSMAVSAFITIALGYGFWALLTAELMLGFSWALYSGTAEAYYHDLLQSRSKQHKLHNKLAKLESYSMMSLTFSTLAGGFLYAWFGTNFCAWLTAAFCFIGFIIICFLPDIKETRRIVASDVNKFQDILNISKFTVRHPEIKWLILFPAFFGALTFVLMWGLQPVMVAKDIPVYVFGFVMGFNMFCRTAWAHFSAVLLDKIKLRKTVRVLFYILCIGSLSSVVVLSLHNIFIVYVMLGLMAVASASQMAVEIITSTFIHHRIKSDERSTVLSVKSMICMMMSGTLMISLKPMIDGIGMQETFLICALILIGTFISMKRLLKLHIKE